LLTIVASSSLPRSSTDQGRIGTLLLPDPVAAPTYQDMLAMMEIALSAVLGDVP
jgi:hypothetical protein